MNKVLLFNHSRIHYLDQGKGQVVVFVHGFLESKDIWDEFTASLKSTFRVIAIDLPGHGESEAVGEVHGMEMQAEIIRAILTREEIEKAVLVGHSMGGYIAATFSEKYEDLSSGLVLFHSQAGPDSDNAKANRLRMCQAVRENKTGFILQFIPALFDPENVWRCAAQISDMQQKAQQMSPAVIVASLMGMRERKGNLHYLPVAKIPILFIIGKKDSRIPYSQTLQQVEMPAHSELLLLEGVGHMGYLEAPGKTMEAVKHFAARCFEE